ncbi:MULTISPECIES: DUF2922 domain-containing protein [unclassified Lysinibacillus]|uniref:DUF2922 domain-containing protein n=1 Tax=unclassified Lysinibacillus TaxID=2636778 RepID=UPI002012BE15|nr:MULTISPECIES: DUF2922 domain-containing protein [unclassified Lysinibacillus]MCL1694410.1 DUF2922 domain-containing protein [Lysinibacillus sp. BPa_S21]MCL1699242.1 DUF2922 domain-containing protein [Lysinibacillus sp. Bpr_S20]
MTQVLELQFETSAGKKATFSIDAPKPKLTTEDIQKVMKKMIAKNVFDGQAGTLVAMSGARIVDRQVTEFDLGIE